MLLRHAIRMLSMSRMNRLTTTMKWIPRLSALSNHDSSSPPEDEFVGSIYQPDAHHSQRGIYLPMWVIRITKTKAEELVLAQLAYWFGNAKSGKVRARIHDDYYWVAKTFGKLGVETCLSKDQVRGAIRSLKKRGVLVTAEDGVPGELVRYRINLARVHALMNKAAPLDDVDDD